MDSQVYKKVGKKYVKIGPSDGWTGFPSEGLWIVQGKPGIKSESWIRKISNIPEDPISYAKLRMRHDEICSSICNFFEEKERIAKEDGKKGYSYSHSEIATRILDDLYNKDFEKNKFKKELIIEKIKSYKINFR